MSNDCRFDKVTKGEISLYLNAVPKDYCDRLIREFHKGFTFKEVIEGVVSGDGVSEYRSDAYLCSKDIHLIDHARWDKHNNTLHGQYLIPVLKDYISNFQYVQPKSTKIDHESCIISLYEKGKGKFSPHQDSVSGYGIQRRSVTIIVYLNTVIEGGSTFFFNQDYRISPRVGAVLVFPSNFVYSHTGETPESGDKYITVSFASIDVGVEDAR